VNPGIGIAPLSSSSFVTVIVTTSGVVLDVVSGVVLDIVSGVVIGVVLGVVTDVVSDVSNGSDVAVKVIDFTIG